MIFGMLNPEKIWHENFTALSTSPVRCSYFTLGNPKKSFSNILLIICYLRRKQTVIHLPTPPENVTTSTCKLQNFFRLSALIQASIQTFSTLISHIMHHAVLKFSPCRNNPLPQASTCRQRFCNYRRLTFCLSRSCNIAFHYFWQFSDKPKATVSEACPRRSTRAMQVIRSTKQQ